MFLRMASGSFLRQSISVAPATRNHQPFFFGARGGRGGGGYGLIRVFGLRVEGSGRLGFWSSGGGAGQVANSWALRVHGAF